MKFLSPSAQAVLDAYVDEDRAGRLAVAAVLRAVANQVAPPWDAPSWDYELVMGNWQESNRIRRDLLAIAAELEAQS
jgi:hypothetical protein